MARMRVRSGWKPCGRRRNEGEDGGFTLLEMLVALALLSMLLAGLFTGLWYGVRAQGSGEAAAERVEQMNALYGVLRAGLGGAVAAQDGTGDPPVFEGGPESVTFLAPMPARFGLGGLHLLRIGKDEDRFSLRWRLYREEEVTEDEAAHRRSILADHIAAIRFGYFGSLDGKERPAWHETWEGSDHLPALVRLRLAFADGASIPELVVALRAAQNPWQVMERK